MKTFGLALLTLLAANGAHAQSSAAFPDPAPAPEAEKEITFKQSLLKYIYTPAPETPTCQTEVYRLMFDCSAATGKCEPKNVSVGMRTHNGGQGSICDHEIGYVASTGNGSSEILRSIETGKTTFRPSRNPTAEAFACAQEQENIAQRLLLADPVGSKLGQHLKIDKVEIDLYSNRDHGLPFLEEDRLDFSPKLSGTTLKVQVLLPAFGNCKPTLATGIASELLLKADGWTFSRKDPVTGTEVTFRADKGRFVKEPTAATTPEAAPATPKAGVSQ